MSWCALAVMNVPSAGKWARPTPASKWDGDSASQTEMCSVKAVRKKKMNREVEDRPACHGAHWR